MTNDLSPTNMARREALARLLKRIGEQTRGDLDEHRPRAELVKPKGE